MTHSEVDEAIREQIDYAAERYGDPTSTHEAYGVLAEEVAELLDAIRANNAGAIRREAIQVAAVATRLGYALTSTSFLLRSGCR